jgi:hypothetical protein
VTNERKIKYIDKDSFLEKNTKEILFDRTGTPLDAESKHRVPHYAKSIESISGDSGTNLTYYIRIYQGTPLDPMGPYARRERNLDTKLQRVSKNTFDLYLTYLKTNNSIYLTKAQRGLLND